MQYLFWQFYFLITGRMRSIRILEYHISYLVFVSIVAEQTSGGIYRGWDFNFKWHTRFSRTEGCLDSSGNSFEFHKSIS